MLFRVFKAYDALIRYCADNVRARVEQRDMNSSFGNGLCKNSYLCKML